MEKTRFSMVEQIIEEVRTSTNTNLGAVDSDSPDTNLTFSISSPHCGMVSLASRPAYPVSKFTQAQLAEGKVLFTHTGET